MDCRRQLNAMTHARHHSSRRHNRISLLFALIYTIVTIQYPSSIEACSSRALPKPRPSTSSSSSSSSSSLGVKLPMTTDAPTMMPAPTTSTTTTTTTTTTTQRPNITFPTYKCPTDFDAWYCLNEATCFSVKIGDSIMYNCECALGFMGPRCEFKEIDGAYLPNRPRPILEKASIASGATCALLFVLFGCLVLYLRYDQTKVTSSLNYVGDKSDATACAFKCRYCNERMGYGYGENDTQYILDDFGVNGEKKYRRIVGNNNSSSTAAIWQHIEFLPMSFAFKRTAKS